MIRVKTIALLLLLTSSLSGAVYLAYALKTSQGRAAIICSAVTKITGPKPQDPTVRANLALQGRPFLANPPKRERRWHYVPVGPMVLPLPPGEWQRLKPDAPSTLFHAESPELQVRVDTYPYAQTTAAAKLSAPRWIELLLGDRLTRIKQPLIAAFRRDLSNGCDPYKDFRTLLLEGLLTELKAVASNSGRSIATRWGRSPTRFALAYESNGITMIRHTQKLGDDAYVIQYETSSSVLAKVLIEQLELVPKTAIATQLPEALTRPQGPRHNRSLSDNPPLTVAREMCEMLTEDWESTGSEQVSRFMIPFTPGSSELSPEANERLQEVAQALEKRSAQINLMDISGHEALGKDPALIKRAREGAVRYWLLRNTGIKLGRHSTTLNPWVDHNWQRIGPAVLVELSEPEPTIDAEIAERLVDEFADALFDPIKHRTSYIRSRRRGEETPIIGLLAPQQRGPFAIDLSHLAPSLGTRFDHKKLFLQDLSHLNGLAEIVASSPGLTQDLATTLHDCMTVDFLLRPILTSLRTNDDRDDVMRYEFTVQLIELSTLDLVGSWTTVHSAPIAGGSRSLLGHETLPFAAASDELTPQARDRLDRALRTAWSRPGTTLKVLGLARVDEVRGSDQAESCLALAAARQSAIEIYLAEASRDRLSLRERSSPPQCGDLPFHQNAMLEIWSEREPTFWELGLLD